ncbi:p-nitrophenyl phosphatase [Tritrichomonas musculus]|uniref:p-nitrophenyl phosphatase n=1 Tax=Tritrichomonas musculus TaxID=1915356 RepID=A0ABR2IDW8_9EUKA
MKSIKTVLFDADGVLWCGDNVVPGAPEVFDKLREMGIHPYLVTNNPTSTRNEIANRLMGKGWHNIPDEMIVSAGYVTTQYLLSIGFSDQRRKVFIIGEPGLIKEMRNNGVNALGIDDFPPENTPEGNLATLKIDENILAVVVALDRTLTYRKLALGNRIIVENDALLVGTNCDTALPLGGGVFVPDAMSNIIALQTSCGRKAVMLGKPSKLMFEPLKSSLNLDASEAMMVGDQFKTDIQFAKNIGSRSTIVLTGVTTKDDVLAINPELKPDYVKDSVRDIPDLVREINAKAAEAAEAQSNEK